MPDSQQTVSPKYKEALTHKAVRLLEQGLLQEAIHLVDQIPPFHKEHLSALLIKTLALLAMEDNQAALTTTEQALTLQPENIPHLINKGLALHRLGACERALTIINQVLKLDPRQIEAYVNQSAILLQQDCYFEALDSIHRGLALDQRRLQLLINEGTALLGLERYQEALAACDRALLHHPGHEALLSNRLLALLELQHLREALLTAKAIPATTLADSGLLDELGTVLLDRGYPTARALIEETAAHRQTLHRQCAHQLLQDNQFNDALQACQTLFEIDSHDWLAYAIKGTTLAHMMRFAEADAALDEAKRINAKDYQDYALKPIPGAPPDRFVMDVDARKAYMIWALNRILDSAWSEREAFLASLPTLVQHQLEQGKLTPLAPFHSLLLPVSPELRLAVARSQSRYIADYVGAPLSAKNLNAHTRLRIGYVSADFRGHATAHLMQGLFALHDRSRFEIIGYSLRQAPDNPYQQQIAADCDRFVDLTTLSNAEAAQRIQDEEIHILVDLMGYTNHSRSEIFARRPAPIQVNYLGFPGTTGADFIDYIIADTVVLPESQLPFFAEQPVYLPECYQVTHRQEIAATGITRKDAGLPEEGFVFCSFNGHKKLEPETFDIWMRLLHKRPHSVLWLLVPPTESIRDHLHEEAQARGIDPQRIVFADYLEKAQHLERCRLADLFLDTFTCNAHTTASDALWAGLPVLTLRGETFPARVASSLLTAIGLEELMTDSANAYEELALHLATHPEALNALREKLQASRLCKPLFNTERFARHLELGFEAMWENHAAGHQPRPISIMPLPEV